AFERVVRQFVLALEKQAAIKTKRQAADFVETRHENNEEEDARNGHQRSWGEAARQRLSEVAQRGTPPRRGQAAEQQNAPEQRHDAGPTLQAVIPARLVLVHRTSGLSDPGLSCPRSLSGP